MSSKHPSGQCRCRPRSILSAIILPSPFINGNNNDMMKRWISSANTAAADQDPYLSWLAVFCSLLLIDSSMPLWRFARRRLLICTRTPLEKSPVILSREHSLLRSKEVMLLTCSLCNAKDPGVWTRNWKYPSSPFQELHVLRLYFRRRAIGLLLKLLPKFKLHNSRNSKSSFF